MAKIVKNVRMAVARAFRGSENDTAEAVTPPNGVQTIEAPDVSVAVDERVESRLGKETPKGANLSETPVVQQPVVQQPVNLGAPNIHIATLGQPSQAQSDLTQGAVDIAFARLMGVTANMGSEQDNERADRLIRRGFGLQRAVIELAKLGGVEVDRITGGNVGRVLAAASYTSKFGGIPQSAGLSSGGMTTFNLPQALSNAANMIVLQTSQGIDESYKDISVVYNHDRYETFKLIGTGGDFRLKSLGMNGTIEHAKFSEEVFTNEIDIKAIMTVIDERAIVNDSVGAFASTIGNMARDAMVTFNDDFWAKFIDDSTFYSAANDNVVSNNALSQTGLTAAVQKLELMKRDGKLIGNRAYALVVPTQLKVVAMGLMASIMATKVSDFNPYAGMFKVVSSPYLADDPTSWYLTVQPIGRAPMTRGYIGGREYPTVESSNADFNQLGIQTRCRFDYGVNHFDPRTSVKCLAPVAGTGD